MSNVAGLQPLRLAAAARWDQRAQAGADRGIVPLDRPTRRFERIERRGIVELRSDPFRQEPGGSGAVAEQEVLQPRRLALLLQEEGAGNVEAHQPPVPSVCRMSASAWSIRAAVPPSAWAEAEPSPAKSAGKSRAASEKNFASADPSPDLAWPASASNILSVSFIVVTPPRFRSFDGSGRNVGRSVVVPADRFRLGSSTSRRAVTASGRGFCRKEKLQPKDC